MGLTGGLSIWLTMAIFFQIDETTSRYFKVLQQRRQFPLRMLLHMAIQSRLIIAAVIIN